MDKLYAYVSTDEKTITDWYGNHVAVITSQGVFHNTPRSWVSKGYRHVRCVTEDGRKFHGRSYGGGLAISLRQLKS